MIHDPINPDAATGPTARNAHRQPLKLLAKLRQSGAKALEVEVHDLSTHGFQVDTVHVIRPCALVWIQFPGFGALEAEVRWFREYRIGCAFRSPLHPAVFATITANAQAR